MKTMPAISMSSDPTPAERTHDRSGLRTLVRRLYVRHIRPRVREPIHQQRLKLLCWDGWGYWRLLAIRQLTVRQRLHALRRFLIVDWHVLHAHKPHEISWLSHALAERAGRPNETVIEAGCWQGGSSTKLSILCRILGYRLEVYDSFQGVEPRDPDDTSASYDFSGEYCMPESVLRSNLQRYGEPDVCSIHPGWFANTLASRPADKPVRLVYIDCDLAKGTREALLGAVPALAPDSWIFSQDFHIEPVRSYLCNTSTWSELGAVVPSIRRVGPCLAAIRFARPSGGSA